MQTDCSLWGTCRDLSRNWGLKWPAFCDTVAGQDVVPFAGGVQEVRFVEVDEGETVDVLHVTRREQQVVVMAFRLHWRTHCGFFETSGTASPATSYRHTSEDTKVITWRGVLATDGAWRSIQLGASKMHTAFSADEMYPCLRHREEPFLSVDRGCQVSTVMTVWS